MPSECRIVNPEEETTSTTTTVSDTTDYLSKTFTPGRTPNHVGPGPQPKPYPPMILKASFVMIAFAVIFVLLIVIAVLVCLFKQKKDRRGRPFTVVRNGHGPPRDMDNQTNLNNNNQGNYPYHELRQLDAFDMGHLERHGRSLREQVHSIRRK